MTIPEIIQEMAQGGNVYESLFAKVITVDATAKTCQIETLNDEMTIFDVRIIANNGDGFLLIPSVDSIVGVCMINEVEGYVSLYSQIDSVQIGDGANGGLIKINDIVSKVNTIESDINDLKTIFSTTWIPVPSDGGAALKTASATWAGSVITETIAADIENTTITHGNL